MDDNQLENGCLYIIYGFKTLFTKTPEFPAYWISSTMRGLVSSVKTSGKLKVCTR